MVEQNLYSQPLPPLPQAGGERETETHQVIYNLVQRANLYRTIEELRRSSSSPNRQTLQDDGEPDEPRGLYK